MNESYSSETETDTFLLILNDLDFVRVGALLGLRARPSNLQDTMLVDSFIDSDIQFGALRRGMLITSLPNVAPQ